MDIIKFKKDVENINWNKYNDSPYYNPQDVPIALMQLALIETESFERIYKVESINYDEVDLLLNAKIESDLLFAIGNDHRGTYYLAAKEALPFIVDIAVNGNHYVAKNCALNALLELFYFYPDIESELLLKSVRQEIRNAVAENKDSILDFLNSDTRNKSLKNSLLAVLNE